jgi:hypothetical protein
MVNARKNVRLPTWRRNFLSRPAKPALGSGRLQRACRRAFVAHDGTITTRIAVEWCYSRQMLNDGLRPEYYASVRDALASIGAQRVERAKTTGRPWVWRLAR